MQFYNVKTRDFVEIDESKLTPKTYVRKTKSGSTQIRYAVQADHEGYHLTKFVSESAFKNLNGPKTQS